MYGFVVDQETKAGTDELEASLGYLVLVPAWDT